MLKQLQTLFASLLSTVIALLGFGSCSNSTNDEDIPLMYGSPYGDFQFSGLVTDENDQPLDKARVIVRTRRDDKGNYLYTQWGCDTTYSDKKGNYSGDMKGILAEKAMILCEDESGEFKADSTIVTLKYDGGDKKDGWYIGTATARVNFKLKKTAEEDR